ncbi:ORF6N domain-containing protein [Chitinophaga barathri]|uniref:ORF6N domain-containing protein n=1 Tax=Chitinophaga barathri TaxID=1647451 RepID=A0A3N4MEG6_9BACT|nr:ORF6N domain-containing protein [Chitinophaga barathri]RPD42372.1 ORF6N domain-containing protein [Chitinophaga barathri]
MAKAKKQLQIPEELVMDKIYMIRGKKIMLDKDLAELYGVKPFRLREQVKRNMDRFPEHFMFQLSEQEALSMVSQNAIPSKQHLGGHSAVAFTEHGVLMLANVLRSERAMQVSIRIIEIFVKMREMLSIHKDVLLQLEKLEGKVNSQGLDIQVIFDYLKQLISPPQEPRTEIGFRKHGQ